MKLLYCPDCGDARALRTSGTVHCECGNAWGLYHTDGVQAVIGGRGIMWGVGNGQFELALVEEAPVFFGWFYHSRWFSNEVMRKDVRYVEKLEDFSYSIFEIREAGESVEVDSD